MTIDANLIWGISLETSHNFIKANNNQMYCLHPNKYLHIFKLLNTSQNNNNIKNEYLNLIL